MQIKCMANVNNSPSSPLILSQWLNKNMKPYQSEQLPTEAFIFVKALPVNVF